MLQGHNVFFLSIFNNVFSSQARLNPLRFFISITLAFK